MVSPSHCLDVLKIKLGIDIPPLFFDVLKIKSRKEVIIEIDNYGPHLSILKK